MTSAIRSIVPTSSRSSFPYSVKMARPFSETFVKTMPMIPNGARSMIQRTMSEIESAVFAMKSFEESDAMRFIASPNMHAQKRMPM